jgi:hypothetical protein
VSGAQPKPVKVGVLHPVTGALAYSGQQCRLGALMAIEDINKAGGIKSLGGAKIEAMLGDAQSSPQAGTAEIEKMNEAAARLSGLSEKHAEDMVLMKYQLDERNKLLVGIYGFVERREDVSPTFENLAAICTSLGDAGGGWISP